VGWVEWGAEAGGHDADAGEARAAELDVATEQGRVGAEATPPQTVAEAHHALVARHGLFGLEGPAEERRGAEHPEEVRRDLSAGDPLGSAGLGEVEVGGAGRGDGV